MIILAERMKDLRKEHHMTQQMLATRLGISSSVISSYELQDRTPSVEMLCRIADLFDISIDYLLGRTDLSVSVRHMKGKPGVVSSKLISLIVELFLCVQDDLNLEINLEQLRQR